MAGRSRLDASDGSLIELSDVVHALGEDTFPHVFMRIISSLIGGGMCAAFSFRPPSGMHLLFAAGSTPDIDARATSAAASYAETYWRADATLHDVRRETSPEVVCQRWDCIRDDKYRMTCYEQPGVSERLSIRLLVNGALTQVGIYRFHGQGSFQSDDLSRMERLGGLLAALAAKHGKLALQQPAGDAFPNLNSMTRRFLQTGGNLSLREAEVCAAVLRGGSAKDVSRLLGIEPSSVVTYRKRAFLKLGITRSNELLRAYEAACPPL